MKYKELSENLKMYRKKENLTQKDLAEKIYKSEITIRKYESGKYNIPPSTLFDICKALKVHSQDLLGSDSDKYHIENFGETLSETLSKKKNHDIISKQIDIDDIENLKISDIKEIIFSDLVIAMSLAANSDEINYCLDDFSEDELREISEFMYMSYELKVNEILNRHKK